MLNNSCLGLLLAALLLATPAFAKNETLAERGKRMCADADVPLSECTILPPAMRGLSPTRQIIATPAPAVPAKTAAFGTGKYGWCADCTSLFAAAPVQEWSTFGGRTFQPLRDEDEPNRTSVADAGGGRGEGSGSVGGSGGGNGGGPGNGEGAGGDGAGSGDGSGNGDNDGDDGGDQNGGGNAARCE